MRKTDKTVGIVGGAGPMAGVLLTREIISICQKEYACINDEDFPKIILLSYPFSDMLKNSHFLKNEVIVKKELKEVMEGLISEQADYIAIACNTLHGFLPDYKKDEKLIDLVEISSRFLIKNSFSKTLILSTTTSSLKNVHDFSKTVRLYEEDQKILEKVIRAMLAGQFSKNERDEIVCLIQNQRIQDPSIDSVLLGCTELSLLHDHFPIDCKEVTIIDPLLLAAKEICKKLFYANH